MKDVATGTLGALGRWLLLYFFTLDLGYLVEWISLNRWRRWHTDPGCKPPGTQPDAASGAGEECQLPLDFDAWHLRNPAILMVSGHSKEMCHYKFAYL